MEKKSPVSLYCNVVLLTSVLYGSFMDLVNKARWALSLSWKTRSYNWCKTYHPSCCLCWLQLCSKPWCDNSFLVCCRAENKHMISHVFSTFKDCLEFGKKHSNLELNETNSVIKFNKWLGAACWNLYHCKLGRVLSVRFLLRSNKWNIWIRSFSPALQMSQLYF